MSKKIFRAIWMVAATVFLASLVLIMGMLLGYFSGVQREHLKTETELAARGIELGGEEYLEGLESSADRITWIAADGTVLYDTQADTAAMENHLEREEVREAMESGYGESSRYSSTLSEKLLYAAVRLSDGSVVRLSGTQSTFWVLLLAFAQPICIVALLALFLSLALASRISKKLVEPINNLDLDAPQKAIGKEEYAEIEPLLRRMSLQQTEIHRAQAELEKTSQIRQEFTANASHELKTPLHAISGYAELLENGMVKEEDIRPFAGKIRAESQRMTKLVEDIIDLTRLDSGAAGDAWEETDLYRIAENAADSLQSTAEAAGVTLTVTGESAPMTGLSQVLYGILYNLCDNGIKYNRPGGKVEVQVQPKGESVLLRVADNGIGIPKEHQSRIFERFYRVDKSHSREVGGTGLGLSIVKHGVLLHHGKIALESTPEEGSVFTLTFPRTQEKE